MTRSYDGPSFLATRSGLGPSGSWLHEGVWCVARHEARWNAWKKIIANIWGTWDSNPGPIGFCTTRLPLDHCTLFVSGISKEYYMWNNNNMPEKIKRSANILNGPIGKGRVIVFPTQPLVFLPADFYPHLNLKLAPKIKLHAIEIDSKTMVRFVSPSWTWLCPLLALIFPETKTPKNKKQKP